MENIKTNIHYLINLIRLISTAQTLHLALQGATENFLHHRTAASVTATAAISLGAFAAELLEAEAGVVAGVDDVAEELVRVLLAAAAEVLGEDPDAALDLGRRVVREIQSQRPCNLLLQYAERTRRPRRIT